MNIAAIVASAERLPFPNVILRAGISALVGLTERRLRRSHDNTAAFAVAMRHYPIAEYTDDANQQHYEVPADFFALVLGPRRKYSSCFYESKASTLAQAEEVALEQTCAHAALADGQSVLELGCGWGSLTLFVAERFPNTRITAVSNSHSQRSAILDLAAQRGLTNVEIITADMNVFAPNKRYDRIVSVEMFEHMSNWDALLRRVRTWLENDGRLFLHVFTHATAPYRFDHADPADWIAQHFFAGGIMPSHNLARCFPDTFAVEDEWRWNGEHYARTARDWLRNFDTNIAAIRPILARTYGTDARLWERRWRLFFLATEGLFGHASGKPWGVSHYRLRFA